MSKREFVTLAVRMLSLFVFFEAVGYTDHAVEGVYGIYKDRVSDTFAFFTAVFYFLAALLPLLGMLILGSYLWLCARRVATSLLHGVPELDARLMLAPPRQVQRVAFSVVGLVLFCRRAPLIACAAYEWMVFKGTAMEAYTHSPRWIGAVLAYGIECLVGLALMVFPHQVVGLLHRIGRTGPESDAALVPAVATVEVNGRDPAASAPDAGTKA